MMQQILHTGTFLIVNVLPFLCGLYSFWRACKKDGFEQEKVFDLVVFAIFGGLLLSLISYIGVMGSLKISFSGFSVNLFAFLLGAVLALIFVTNRWRWSVYRILDNFSVALLLGMAFWFLLISLEVGFRVVYILAAILLFVVNYFLPKYRLETLKSGFTFCIICGVFCLAGIMSLRTIPNLIFLVLLFTLTLAVLIFRSRGIYGANKKTGSTSTNS